MQALRLLISILLLPLTLLGFVRVLLPLLISLVALVLILIALGAVAWIIGTTYSAGRPDITLLFIAGMATLPLVHR